ncbi:MAG: hypothetical protein M1828_004275 [Chrysothrix sp. TS-e1954]|nr:MAG: hypothetical protein M1828_004275 [Chrysothrix sp. TS-e1954]
MASPDSITLRNLNGDFVMNKKLSDDFDPILSMQGVGWLTRKAIGLATLTLHIKEYTDDEGVVHIDIDQTATGGVKGTSEKRVLNNTEREHNDHVFGKVKGSTKWMKLSDVEDPFLKSKWLPETEKDDVIENTVTSMDSGWVASQVWAFQEVNGMRMYARNVVVTKGKDRKEARLVYDYVSK